MAICSFRLFEYPAVCYANKVKGDVTLEPLDRGTWMFCGKYVYEKYTDFIEIFLYHTIEN